ncbi:hypothetical protein M8C13_31650 [Crossiella sp. SN42]|uniref:VC0807 family protein n=1 Tax=Crossiella sp. SN42 TaxID=2944808 RepID=UPI00207C97F3|nr:VC0807 family protein [Crossiella sp. SN42]MCO1580322.1 hypothetical protein [Crossiella sp. SN42]
MSTSPAATPRQSRGLLGVLPYALDVIIPIATYFILKSLGASDFWALVTGGLLTAANSLANTIRRGKLDNLGVLVIVEVAVGLVLDFTFQDPRLILARGSLYIAIAGIWILVNTFTSRPITVDVSKPMAYKGDPHRLTAYEWCAEHSREFLRIHRALSATWCVMFLAYAAIRVVIIYHVSSVQESIWLNEIPGVIGVLVCLVAAARAGKRLEKIVDAQVARMFPAAAGA